MSKLPKYLLVETQALPEVFERVMQAKELLNTGEAKNSTAAAKRVGLSRSAFYKYKDKVFKPNSGSQHLVTFSLTLKDETGILSKIISTIAGSGANILTINQSIPIDGVAPVTISVRTDDNKDKLEELMVAIKSIPGVIKLRQFMSE